MNSIYDLLFMVFHLVHLDVGTRCKPGVVHANEGQVVTFSSPIVSLSAPRAP